MNRIGRELVESIGFFCGIALFSWGVRYPDVGLFWILLAAFPFVAFLPPLMGPKNFRVALVLVGLAIAIIYVAIHGLASGVGLHFLGTGAGLVTSGIFLTPRTQRALAVLRTGIALAIVAWFVHGIGFAEPDFGTGAMVLLSPVALLLVIGFMTHARVLCKSSASERWYEYWAPEEQRV